MAHLPQIQWSWHGWPGLPASVLYDFLRLRSDVFVVEQHCAYADMDGVDPACEHLCAHDAQGRLLSCLRLVPPGIKAPQPALGRLVVAAHARGLGLGRQAMLEGIRRSGERHPGQGIFLSGQLHLEPFYQSLGFARVTEPYVEDGIQHVNMIRPA